MIKFFRKIRQQLLAENRLGKYLIYALGEIVLVVIGILIALQINNWNEAKKTTLVETEMLKNLMSDLQASHRQIELMVTTNTNRMRAYERLMGSVGRDSINLDSLNKDFGMIPTWNTPYLTYSSYEALKTKGLE